MNMLEIAIFEVATYIIFNCAQTLSLYQLLFMHWCLAVLSRDTMKFLNFRQNVTCMDLMKLVTVCDRQVSKELF